LSTERRIRDVVFDLGGVVIDWDPRYLLRDRLGFGGAEVEEFLATVCTREWHLELDAGRPFAAAAGDLGARFPERRAWIEAYCGGWQHMFAGALAEGVELLHELKRRGFGLHALSNYPAEHIGFLYRRFPFMREFDTVVLSGLLGVTKPDRAIFDYLRQRLGSRACLFIDDRPENVASARACGIEAVHVDGAAALAVVRELLAAPAP
jgi:2-haloacid dehalogenase